MTVLSSAHADEAAAWDAGVLGMLGAGCSSGGCIIDGGTASATGCCCGGDCACCAVAKHGSCGCDCDCDGGNDSSSLENFPASMRCHRGHGAGDR